MPKDAQEAFNHLKQIPLNQPTLANPDYSLPFTLITDISKGNDDIKGSFAAILTQESQGKPLPISFWSRSLTEKEEKLPSVVLKKMCIMKAYKSFFHILFRHECTVKTDARPVVDLAKKETELYNYLTEMISQTNKKIEHVPGAKSSATYYQDTGKRKWRTPESTLSNRTK